MYPIFVCPSPARCWTARSLPAHVVDDDRAVDPGGPPVHQHERDALLGELGDMVVVERREGDDQAVDAAIGDRAARIRLLDGRLVGSEERLGLDDHDELAGRRGRRLDAVRDLAEAKVVQARDDQPDRVGAARAQPTRERVGPVAELPAARGSARGSRAGPAGSGRRAGRGDTVEGSTSARRATSLSVAIA